MSSQEPEFPWAYHQQAAAWNVIYSNGFAQSGNNDHFTGKIPAHLATIWMHNTVLY